MERRKIRTLEEWKGICAAPVERGASTEALLGTGWTASEITPPPALGHPLARVPLERAAAFELQASRAESREERARSLRRALEWLDHPHPRTPPAVRRTMERRKRVLVAAARESTGPGRGIEPRGTPAIPDDDSPVRR